MKYVLALLLVFATPTMAQHHMHRGHHPHAARYWHPHFGWVLPSIVGGVVVYEVLKNNPPAPPVIVQQEPVQTQVVVCSEWKEIATPDGKIYRERTCSSK